MVVKEIAIPDSSIRRRNFRPVDARILPQPSVLILVLTDELNSWGYLHASGNRSFENFLDMISATKYPASDLSLGLLTSSDEAFENYTDILRSATSIPFDRVDIISMPELPLGSRTNDVDWARQNRHDPKNQLVRRKYLARLRNYLSSSTLRSQKHIIWLDSDVWYLPDGLFQRFLQISETETKNLKVANAKEEVLPVGLMTLLCVHPTSKDYDRNAWAGFGYRPSQTELKKLNSKKGKAKLKDKDPDTWAKSMSELIKGTTDNQIVHLDSVGGTALYIRADLVREGLIFPHYNAVGTTWETEGDDAVETEGLCYLASRMGWGCYGLAGGWATRHADV